MAENILPYKIKTCPKCKQEKTTLDFHKNKGKPDGLHNWCKVCAIANVKKHTAAKPEARKAYMDKWREENPSYNAEHYAKDPEWHRQRSKKYKLENPESLRKGLAAWGAANRAKGNAKAMRRAANKKNATPAWADLNDIELFYRCSRKAPGFSPGSSESSRYGLLLLDVLFDNADRSTATGSRKIAWRPQYTSSP